jgi:hypothetical protein
VFERFSLVHNFQACSATHPASYTGDVGVVSPGLKRQRRELDHLPPYSTEVKSGGAISPLPISLYDVVLN